MCKSVHHIDSMVIYIMEIISYHKFVDFQIHSHAWMTWDFESLMVIMSSDKWSNCLVYLNSNQLSRWCDSHNYCVSQLDVYYANF